MQTQKYARKPFYIDAVQVTEENMAEVAEWCGGTQREANGPEAAHIKIKVHRPFTPRQTKAFVGDWVLKSETGFKIYTPVAFERGFEPVKTVEEQADETIEMVEEKPAEVVELPVGEAPLDAIGVEVPDVVAPPLRFLEEDED